MATFCFGVFAVSTAALRWTYCVVWHWRGPKAARTRLAKDEILNAA